MPLEIFKRKGRSIGVEFLTDKNGVRILPIIEDMRKRANAILIVNLACDDDFAQINSFVIRKYADIAALGIISLAKSGNCGEVIIYCGNTSPDDLIDAIKFQSDITASVIHGPASPVLRDDTALYSAMDHGHVKVYRAELDHSSMFLSYGYHGRPTLVIDAETAYQVGRVYKTPNATLTKLISVTYSSPEPISSVGVPNKISKSKRTDANIEEVDIGTPLSHIMPGLEYGDTVLTGGFSGRFSQVSGLNVRYVEFGYQYDSLTVFSGADCILSELAGLYSRINELSCSKCVLCREGSWQLCTTLQDITAGRANRDDIALIEDICPIIQAGALCRFGRDMVLPAFTAVLEYREIFQKHVIGKTCLTGRCSGFINYVIDPSLCTGCGECVGSCPNEAIEGKDSYIHVIDSKLCDKCGDCLTFCPAGAIKVDSEKIRVPKKPVKVGMFR